jgi:LemA protein
VRWIAWIALAVAAMTVAGSLQYSSVKKGLEQQTDAIDAQWVNVDDALRQRADLIPDFVQTVRRTVADRAAGVAEIANARASLAAGRTPQEKIQAYGRLDGAFSRLLALTENYPQLRSDKVFQRHLDEIAVTENRIAVERQKYNEALENYNASIQVFPNNLVASVSKFARRDAYFRPSLPQN